MDKKLKVYLEDMLAKGQRDQEAERGGSYNDGWLSGQNHTIKRILRWLEDNAPDFQQGNTVTMDFSFMEVKTLFPVGTDVLVHEDFEYITHEFTGHVVGYKGESDGSWLVQVSDQDGDVFDCPIDQLRSIHG